MIGCNRLCETSNVADTQSIFNEKRYIKYENLVY